MSIIVERQCKVRLDIILIYVRFWKVNNFLVSRFDCTKRCNLKDKICMEKV